ncbi:MAG: HEPN domain-containing protein [Nitrospira sp.]|nr:HEPN domain-containing protein [Nitrospira sp.]
MKSASNQKLCNAMKAYVIKGLHLIAKSGSSRILQEEEHWVRISEDMFRRELRPSPISLSLSQDHECALHSLLEYIECIAALRSDEVISSQVDKSVGSPFSRYFLSAESVIDRIFFGTIRGQGGYNFDEECFKEEYIEMEKVFYEDSISFQIIAPLDSFKSTVATIELEQNIKINQLSDEEINLFIQLGLCPNLTYGKVRVPKYAIRYHYSMPKVIGDRSFTTLEKEKMFKEQKEIGDCIEEILRALQAFKWWHCSLMALIHHTSNWLLQGGIRFQSFPTMYQWSHEYVCYEEDADSFSKFWSDIRKIHRQGGRGYLDVALRRFGYAGERHLPEDQVIDLLIAAESLFLNDEEGKKNVGEKSFRLSLRAAMFIDIEPEKQGKIYNHIKKAYDIRSTIVHGGSPKLPKKTDGTIYTLSEFSELTSEYIRMAIRKEIDRAKNPLAPKLIDWERLIFHRGSKIGI